jgi:hypothetical protein
MVTASPKPRYDRIVSLVLLVLLGLAVVLLIDINPSILRARLGGDLPIITVSWLLIASLVVIISTGTDVFIRSHPEMQLRSLPALRFGPITIELVPAFWILPSLTIVASFAFFRLFSASLDAIAFIIALVVAGILLFSSLIAQHYALDRRPGTQRLARLALQATALVLAFGIFSAIQHARMRTLYSAALVGTTGMMLSYALLYWVRSASRLTLLSLSIGLTLAEATWALNYWSTSFLISGALLLVLFHVVTGMLQNHLEQRLDARVVTEYLVLGGGLLGVLVVVMLR